MGDGSKGHVSSPTRTVWALTQSLLHKAGWSPYPVGVTAKTGLRQSGLNMSDLIQTVLIYALPVIFAITLHEAAHGYAALRLGDNTASMLGRVTLNPFPHIDPLGTILLPLLLYFSTSGAFLFGYAKPVPVRFDQLRHPKRDMVWVALAGPGANLVQALIWGVLFYVLTGNGINEDVQSRHAHQCGYVCLQPFSAATTRRRAHPGGRAALAPGGAGVPC